MTMAPTAFPDPVARPARHDVQMDGVFFFRAFPAPDRPWRLEPGNYSYCIAVRSGRLRLETDFPVAIEIDLGPGDVLGVSGLDPHVFRSPDQPSDLAARLVERHPMESRRPGADIGLIIGAVPNEFLALASLMVGPIVVRPAEHPQLARRLWRAIDMLEDEYADNSWLDRGLVVRRLAEIMTVNITRRVFADAKDASGDAPRPPASRQIIQAINAVSDAPGKPWTLDELARTAGMSRTRFAAEFKFATGQTPARIISRMRLTETARRLSNEALSVAAAAEAAGYSSAAAFVRAFQRAFGETPARWRRHRQPVEPAGGPASRHPSAKGEARGANRRTAPAARTLP
jgi:AraC-like DNA-binding protein